MPATVLYGTPLKRDKYLEAPANSTPTVTLARMPYTSCLPAYSTPLHHEKKLQKGLPTLSLITPTVGLVRLPCTPHTTPLQENKPLLIEDLADFFCHHSFSSFSAHALYRTIIRLIAPVRDSGPR